MTCSPGIARICAWVNAGSTSCFSAVSIFSRAASIRQRRNLLYPLIMLKRIVTAMTR